MSITLGNWIETGGKQITTLPLSLSLSVYIYIHIYFFVKIKNYYLQFTLAFLLLKYFNKNFE